jgi:hypothetical protein
MCHFHESSIFDGFSSTPVGSVASSNVQRTANKSLIERDLIDREDRSFTVIDRFFRIWIREREDN